MDLFSTAEFTAHVEDLLATWHVPGCAIGVLQDGITKSRSYGKSSLERGKEPDVSGADTVFDIASCSKCLTAVAVALLVEDDENYPDVKWDTPVSKLLPDDFALADEEYTRRVTVEDILSHRSGLPGHDFASMSSRAADPDTLRSITRKLRHLELSAPVRSKWQYNNLMYTAAAYLVECLTGLKFGEFLKQRIWDPLGMESTQLQSKAAAGKGLVVAQPYKWNEQTSSHKEVKIQHCPEAIGAGLITTTAADYIKFISAILAKKYPITQAVYDGITKPRAFANEDDGEDLPPFTSPEFYATGLSSSWYRGYEVLAHDGGDPGIASTIFMMPAKQFGCVIFTNATAGGNLHPILRHELVDAAIGVPVKERIDWATRERELEDQYLSEREQKLLQRRKDLSPETDGNATHLPLESLERYAGGYQHPGYGTMTVQIKDEKLFIDANDRTMGFTLRLEHLYNGVKFFALQKDYFGDYDNEFLEAQFVLEGDRPVKLGLNLESDIEGERVWFRRIPEKMTALAVQ